MKYYDAKFVKAQFDSLAGLTTYCIDAAVENGDRALALLIYKVLWARKGYLERKFGFKNGDDQAPKLPTMKAREDGPAAPSVL